MERSSSRKMISRGTAQKNVHYIMRLDDVSLSTLVIDLQGNISSTGKDLALAKRFFLESKVMKKGNVSKSSVQALETGTREQKQNNRGSSNF
jgi:hypothetical protein